MNARARALGLRHTHFANPIGLDDPGNYSSAADLARLTVRLRRNAFFRRTVGVARARLRSGARPRVVDNRNDLVGRAEMVDGVKTGHTVGAGYVLVGSATRGGVSVVSAVLGEPGEGARDADTLALLRYGLSLFRLVPIVQPDRVLATASVKYREEDRIQLVPARRVARVLRRGERPAIAARAPKQLEGPLAQGAVVGSVTARVRNRVVARVPLVTAQEVPEVGILERAFDFIFKPATLAVIVFLMAGAALLVLAGRRRRSAQEKAAAQ
jgi:D-alanyl-D-alanine carboxypeptidase (penicillin-binding protein 5/6)